MPLIRHTLTALAIVSSAAAVTACSAGGNQASGTFTSDPGEGGGGASSANGEMTTGSTQAGGPDPVGVGGGSGSGGGSTEETSLIYAHTDTTLFTLDPTSPTLAITKVGDFDCIGGGSGQATSMTDIAVDKSQNVFAVSAAAVYPITVKGQSAHCGTPIVLDSPSSGDLTKRFYALSFAPAGVLDSTKEVLVAGNTAGELWSIDAQGASTIRGNFGKVPANDGHGHVYKNAGKAWELSGDIVFLYNKGNPIGFATVRDCPNPPSSSNCDTYPDKTPILDTLIEIDLTKLAKATATTVVTRAVRGKIVKRTGCKDDTDGAYGHMFGIAAWNDKVYGMSRAGNLVDIDITDGAGCLVQGYPDSKFSGAGVTTLAPVIPPPQ